jgi:N-acetylneuraminate synthase
MATLPEVEHAVSVLRRTGCKDLTLLHCVSSYPVRAEDCNLAAIATLRGAFECPVGWSDHSVQPGVIYRAVHRWGASVIEFHLDLEGKGSEFDSGHCWLPEQMRSVIASLHAGFLAEGDGQVRPVASEMKERGWRADPGDGLRPLKSIRHQVQIS